MLRFHPLDVTEIRPETRDAVVVTLRPRPGDAARFGFVPGQYLTFRRAFDGVELRRSYSICSATGEGVLEVGIKRVAGGTFSTWANTALRPGDTLEAMPPQGRFWPAPDPGPDPRHYLVFAGGSGITPVLSILRSVLRDDPGARFTLVYANRQVGTIMFREALEDLKNTWLGRLSILHVLENDAQEIDLFTGRIDAARMEDLLRLWIDITRVHTALICGPQPMMQTIAESLRTAGLPPDRIRFELFSAAGTGRAPRPAPVADPAAAAGCDLSVTLDGATRSFRMARDGTAVLDALLRHDLDVPYACKAGVCSTCRARVIEGAVEMRVNHALGDDEVRAGYVLSCQCIPQSDRLVLSYDD